ncbi:hypothetical protein WA026_016703 [Henosepilachna vigintioctopunctata]|uniref:Regulator of microtubule dynamics protein 1 n=1 Tax=Henosepilachna vigintioctopunctata TaxID=420089 RepID=A0AAW1UZ92_9CUCU
MTLIMLSFSALLATLFIFTATTMLCMIQIALPKEQKTHFKRYERRSRCYKNEYEDDVKLEKSETEDQSLQATTQTIKTLQQELDEVDQGLRGSIDTELCLKQLEYLNRKYPDQAEILCMIGMAHQKLAFATEDLSVRKYHIDRGMAACQTSLEINCNQSEAHKWIAILIGLNGETQTTKEKIESGKLFKKHLDAAIGLKPEDPVLQHLAGRFCYEISSLNWVEQKLVKNAFPEPLNCTYDKALLLLLKCERLYEPGWKENRLFIAKCYIAKKITDKQ